MKKLLLFCFIALISCSVFAQVKSDADMNTYNNTYIKPNNTGAIKATMHNTLNKYIINSKINRDSIGNVQVLGDTALVVIYKNNPPDTVQIVNASTSGWATSGDYVYLINVGDSVGIGTASPGYKLFVNGGFGGSTYMVLQPTAKSGARDGQIYNDVDNHLYYYNGLAWKQLDNASGEVDISGDTLFVNGDTIIVSPNYWAKDIAGNITNNNTGDVRIANDIQFVAGQTHAIGITNNTPYPGNHLLIQSGIGTITGTSIAGNIYITPPLADTPGNVILNVDTAGNKNGFTGIGVAVPQQMLDVGGQIKVHSLDTLIGKHLILVFDETDSTLAVIPFDSVGGGGASLWYLSGDTANTVYNVKLDSNLFLNKNLNLVTTTATDGQIKQNGTTVFHTYHEKGDNNLFIGQGAGNFTADSSGNIGIGASVLDALTIGYRNVAVGYKALDKCYKGFENVAIGFESLYNDTSGTKNTAIGAYALAGNLKGSTNTAIGSAALYLNSIGISNTALGFATLYNNAGGYNSVALGYMAMYNAYNGTSLRGTYNTAIGYEAMKGSAIPANNTGQYNTAIGYQALDAMTSGEKNTAIGVDALGANTTGSNNIGIGYNAGNTAAYATLSNRIYIGTGDTATAPIYVNAGIGKTTINGDLHVTGNLTVDGTSPGGAESDPVWIADSSAFLRTIDTNTYVASHKWVTDKGYLTALPASALEWSDTTASAGVGVGTFDDIRDTAAAIRADFPAPGGGVPPVIISWDGQGGVVGTGNTVYRTMAYAGTITGWSITATGTSPTCTIDIWRVATGGTTLPAVGNTIMGTKPALSTGNIIRSTTLTAWNPVAFSAGDTFGFNIGACAAALKITFSLTIQ
jgi:hypothetical protein